MIFAAIGALIGALTGGWAGFLIGAVVGHYAGVALGRYVIGSLRVVQTNMFDSVFAIMGALCKADSVVSREEIKAVEQIFRMLNLQGEQREQAKAAFNRGKQPEFELDAEVDRFAALTRGRGPLLQLFLQLQVMAVSADGRIDPAERDMLLRIARRLGLSDVDVSQLEALLRASTGRGSAPGGPAPQDRLADAYTALGVSADSTPTEIKRAYRKLISENHPDKLAARGLPESMRPVAEERSRELNAAYDLLKEARGIK